MSFLRRLLGDGEREGEAAASADAAAPASDAELEAAEREYEREVLRAESERLDELRQRQLRYADRAWKPPAQGGDRRSGDESPEDEG